MQTPDTPSASSSRGHTDAPAAKRIRGHNALVAGVSASSAGSSDASANGMQPPVSDELTAKSAQDPPLTCVLTDVFEHVIDAIMASKLHDLVSAWKPELVPYIASLPASSESPLLLAVQRIFVAGAAFLVCAGMPVATTGSIQPSVGDLLTGTTKDCASITPQRLHAELVVAHCIEGATSKAKIALREMQPFINPIGMLAIDQASARAAAVKVLCGFKAECERKKQPLPDMGAFIHEFAPATEPGTPPFSSSSSSSAAAGAAKALKTPARPQLATACKPAVAESEATQEQDIYGDVAMLAGPASSTSSSAAGAGAITSGSGSHSSSFKAPDVNAAVPAQAASHYGSTSPMLSSAYGCKKAKQAPVKLDARAFTGAAYKQAPEAACTVIASAGDKPKVVSAAGTRVRPGAKQADPYRLFAPLSAVGAAIANYAGHVTHQAAAAGASNGIASACKKPKGVLATDSRFSQLVAYVRS